MSHVTFFFTYWWNYSVEGLLSNRDAPSIFKEFGSLKKTKIIQPCCNEDILGRVKILLFHVILQIVIKKLNTLTTQVTTQIGFCFLFSLHGKCDTIRIGLEIQCFPSAQFFFMCCAYLCFGTQFLIITSYVLEMAYNFRDRTMPLGGRPVPSPWVQFWMSCVCCRYI